MRRLGVVLAAAVLTGCGTDAVVNATADRGRVQRVTDGDTIVVVLGGREERVRLVGISAPERGVCGARGAARHLEALVAGRGIVLVRDGIQPARDRNGRLLAYAESTSGRDAGAEMIRAGWAHARAYGRGFDRERPYQRLEREARTARRNVWSRCPGGFEDD